MEKNLAEIFWKRVKGELMEQGKDLSQMAAATGIKYDLIRSQRLRRVMPRGDDLLLISNYLDMSIDMLVKGFAKGPKISTRALRIARELDRRGPAIMDSVETLLGLYEQPDEKKNIG